METLTAWQWDFLIRLAGRVVPETADLDEEAWARFRAIVEEALGARPPAVRRQFGALLGILRWLPLLRYGRPFEGLAPERQDAALGWFQEAPLRPLRQGFWGLKALVFMGYYGRAEAGAGVGYVPDVAGNDRLHD